MLTYVDRVRSTDALRDAIISGYSIMPDLKRSYTTGAGKLGMEKVIVDKVVTRPPYIRRKGRSVRAGSERKARLISEPNPVRIQQFKSFCSKGAFDTRGSLPMYWTNYVLSGEFANCISSDSRLSGILDGKPFRYFSEPPQFDQQLADWCVEKAWNSCAEPDGELSVALSELPMTLALLTSPFKAARSLSKLARRWTSDDAWVLHPKRGLISLRTKRKMDVGKATKQMLDEAANRWLELQYGLLPTISDAEVAVAAIQEKLEPLRDIMYGKSKYTAVKSEKSYRGLHTFPPNVTCESYFTVKRKVQYTSKVYYRYKNVPNLKDRIGFRGNDLPNFILELTPWSFVLDWLWDIGGLLHRLAYANLITVASNYVSVKYDSTLVGHLTGCKYANYYECKVPSSKLYYHQEELVRHVNQKLPDLPQFNVKWFNITRSLNAISLLWQLLPR